MSDRAYLIGYGTGMLVAGLTVTRIQTPHTTRWFFAVGIVCLFSAWWLHE